MLTDAELTAMRSTMGDSLAGHAIIQSQSFASDGGGGGTTTWAAAGTYDCRVAPVASSGEGEGVEGGRVHSDTEYIFTLPESALIDHNSLIVYDTDNYAVTALRAPRTWEISRRVEAKRVD